MKLNYKKARDWEVIQNAREGYPEAVKEAERRKLKIEPYRPKYNMGKGR